MGNPPRPSDSESLKIPDLIQDWYKEYYSKPEYVEKLKIEQANRAKEEAEFQEFLQEFPPKYSKLPYKMFAMIAWDKVKGKRTEIESNDPNIQDKPLPDDAILLGPYAFSVNTSPKGRKGPEVFFSGILTYPSANAQLTAVKVDMPDKEKKTFLLVFKPGAIGTKYLCGVAESIGCKRTTVKSNITRMRDRIQKAVGPVPPIDSLIFIKEKAVVIVGDSKLLPSKKTQ